MTLKIDIEIQHFVKRSISLIITINSNFKSILRSMKNLFTFDVLILVNKNLY